jgi:hypothetical protein
MINHSSQKTFARAATLAIVAATLFSISSTPAAAQTVGACVSFSNGKFRLMPVEGCSDRELTIEWNLRGQVGPEGPQGPTGPQGPAGPQGPQGAGGGQGDRGPSGAAGSDGAQGLTGPEGPEGPQGPQGPQGADGKPGARGGLFVVDANGIEVGALTDVHNAHVVRPAGDDLVLFIAPKDGLPAARTIFFHAQENCSGERQFLSGGGQGLAYFAFVHGSAVFYTKTIDPFGAIGTRIVAAEVIEPGQDASLPGRCVPYDGGMRSTGPVTMFVDPALGGLTAPFRIR